MLIGFRRSSNRAQKQIKAVQGNCKIYCAKLNYGILVKHNILNFRGSITRLLNYNCDQGMMWNTLAPILQGSKSGTMQRSGGLVVFPGDGYKDTHHLGYPVWLMSVSLFLVNIEIIHLHSKGRGASYRGFGCSYGISSLVTWTRTQNRVAALGRMPMDSAPIFQLIGIQLRRAVLCREKFII